MVELDFLTQTPAGVIALRDDVMVGVSTGPMTQDYVDATSRIFQKCSKLYEHGIAIVVVIRQDALEAPAATRQTLIRLISDYRELVKRVAIVNETTGPFSGSLARMIATAINLVSGQQQYRICATRREAAQIAAKTLSTDGKADEAKVRGIIEALSAIEQAATEAA